MSHHERERAAAERSTDSGEQASTGFMKGQGEFRKGSDKEESVDTGRGARGVGKAAILKSGRRVTFTGLLEFLESQGC